MSDENIDLDNESEGLNENDAKLRDAPAAHVDSASVAERQAVRDQLEADVQAFLAKGGKIDVVEPNVLADPPKKPQSNYGGQPI